MNISPMLTGKDTSYYILKYINDELTNLSERDKNKPIEVKFQIFLNKLLLITTVMNGIGKATIHETLKSSLNDDKTPTYTKDDIIERIKIYDNISNITINSLKEMDDYFNNLVKASLENPDKPIGREIMNYAKKDFEKDDFNKQ